MRTTLCVITALSILLGSLGSGLAASGTKRLEKDSDKVFKDLGYKSPMFGSTKQAQELLKLIKSNPDKKRHEIGYRTDVDFVVFKCDRSTSPGTITRIHWRKGADGQPNGHGTVELWCGYVMERLKGGASGDSLNDTPEGNQPGTFQVY